MNSFDFRERVVKDIRAFEKWAYEDQKENPDDWDENMSYMDWISMFMNSLSKGS